MPDQDQPIDLPPVQTDASSTAQPQKTEATAAVPGAGPTKEIILPDEANDSDLIEKEWVEKAKDIVDHTKDNPHEQQDAINQMKAEYMKKRYNRDIKVGEP